MSQFSRRISLRQRVKRLEALVARLIEDNLEQKRLNEDIFRQLATIELLMQEHHWMPIDDLSD
jgi:RIO-like serine/threonine protein kinase